MQISRSQPSVQVPRTVQNLPTPAETRRPQEAPGATRASEARPEAEPLAPSARERIGSFAQSVEDRLEHLAAKEGLAPEQAAALKEAHQAFKANLARLAAAHLEGGQPNPGLAQGFAKVMNILRHSVHEAKGKVQEAKGRPDAQGEESGAAQRLASAHEAISARLQHVLASGKLEPRTAAAFEQMIQGFDALFERLGQAVEQGSLKAPGKLAEAFAQLMSDLRQDAKGLLHGGGDPPSGLYSPSGTLAGEDLASTELEHLA